MMACPHCGEVSKATDAIPRLLTVEQMADQLGVTSKRGYDLIARHIVPSEIVVRLGRQIRVRERGLVSWVLAGGQGL